MTMLIKGMESEVEGLRGATAQTCRNIYVLGMSEEPELTSHWIVVSKWQQAADILQYILTFVFLDLKYRAEFKRHGGITALVKSLDMYDCDDVSIDDCCCRPTGDVDPESLFNQLEAVYHLEDLILVRSWNELDVGCLCEISIRCVLRNRKLARSYQSMSVKWRKRVLYVVWKHLSR